MSPRAATGGGLLDGRVHPSAVQTIFSGSAYLSALRAIGNLELLIDATDGMTTAAGLVTSLTDLSGNARAITIVAAPAATVTTWNTSQPAIHCTLAVPFRVTVTMPAMPVYSMVAAVQSLTVGAADSSFYRDAGDNAISYVRSAGSDWSLYNGTVFSSTFTAANSPNRYVRIDVVNGASSFICRSGTEQSGDAGVARGGINTNPLTIGMQSLGTAPLTCDLATIAFYSKALTAPQRALALATVAGRYTGMTLV